MENLPAGFQVIIELPLPSSKLNAHNKGHWSRKSGAVKSRRNRAMDETVLYCIENQIERDWSSCSVQFTFYVPNNRPRDTCNMIQQEKATIDGIVDSGLIPGDNWQVMRILEPRVQIDRENPRVVIQLVQTHHIPSMKAQW